MEVREVIGFSGDLINFGAALLLAWDPVFREKIFVRLQSDGKLTKNVTFVDPKDNPVLRGDDKERVLVRGESRRSQWAFILLIVGFGAITVARGLEIRAHRMENAPQAALPNHLP